MALASGVASSSLFNGNGGDSDEEDVNTLTNVESQATTGVPGYTNDGDDLDGKTVSELRSMIRDYDYKSLDITNKQINGQGGFRRKDLIRAIRKLR